MSKSNYFRVFSRVLKIQGEIFAVEPNGSNMITKLYRDIMTIFLAVGYEKKDCDFE